MSPGGLILAVHVIAQLPVRKPHICATFVHLPGNTLFVDNFLVSACIVPDIIGCLYFAVRLAIVYWLSVLMTVFAMINL